MTVKILDDYQKRTVAARYRVGVTPNEMAKQFDVSVRTIVRVLTEAGTYKVRTPKPKLAVDPNTAQCMSILATYGLDAAALLSTLRTPTLTRISVQQYLNSRSHTELASIFYATATHKAMQVPVPVQAQEIKTKPTPIYKQQPSLLHAEHIG